MDADFNSPRPLRASFYVVDLRNGRLEWGEDAPAQLRRGSVGVQLENFEEEWKQWRCDSAGLAGELERALMRATRAS